ncbi:hypothetical protein AB0E96_39460, partial [Kitasatospora sp. NPDC036755]|uniref:hypothetical protein n=1 Tax=Kitasatospora sp. NPDC036755 TaxID=3154600 RepID=UPI0033D29AEA
MSLTGLLDVVARDAAIAEAIEAATAPGAAAGGRRHLDLVGPPAARPFAVAAVARAGRQQRADQGDRVGARALHLLGRRLLPRSGL